MFLSRRNLAILIAVDVVLFLWIWTPRWLTTANTGSPEVLNSTLGFQHIFAINLPSRTDRRDAMTLAAALTELKITWVDGVAGKNVLDKVLPGDPDSREGFTIGNKGSWRAHMNVLQRIVDENITSALILEDDADWDIRLKQQMQLFARVATAFTERLHGETVAEESRTHHLLEISAHHEVLRNMPLPRRTPYGEDWDVLWLGHCGTEFPAGTAANKPPPLRVIISNDATVAPPRHLKPHPFALQDALAEKYSAHTRVVHASSGTACTQAYAVSQQGARKLLWKFGLQQLTTGWDLMLRDWCDGLHVAERESGPVVAGSTRRRKRGPVCVTVQPPLFSHHYGKGAASDIMTPGGGFVNKGKEMTPYVRVSVRLNMERLVEGEDARDQWEEDADESG